MPNLDAAARRAERLMTDTCTIVRDQLRLNNALLDVTTGRLTPDVTDDSQIYTGKCFVSKPNRIPRYGEVEDGSQQAEDAYNLSIPIAGPLLRVGDEVTITAAKDLPLIGKVFTITGTDAGTLTVWRSAAMCVVQTNRDH